MPLSRLRRTRRLPPRRPRLNMRAEVPGYEGYFASPTGRIYSNLSGKIRELKQRSDRKAYSLVTVFYEGRSVPTRVHTLVLLAFAGQRPDGMEARHLDGNGMNNRADNLVWSTHLENMHDKRIHGTENYGEKNGGSKLSVSDVREIRDVYATGGFTQGMLASDFGISQTQVSRIIRGKKWGQIS